MLIDINLLPPKPPKNMANYLTLLITAIIFITGLAYFYNQGDTLKKETDHLIVQRENFVRETLRLEQELAMLEVAHSDLMIQATILEALNQTINTTQLMNEIKNHLPPEATVLNYTYTVGTDLFISFLVDESHDIGTFVENLAIVPWVLNARVESVTFIPRNNKFQGNVTITLDRAALTSWKWEGIY